MSDLTSYYEKGHAGYTASDHASGDSRLANLVESIRRGVKPGGKILDLGCGDMSLSKLLPEYAWVGLDLDTSKDPRIIKQDITHTPYNFPANFFNAVVCSEVIEHLFDPVAVLKEARRLTPFLILTVPNLRNLDLVFAGPDVLQFDPANQISVEHIRWYTPHSLISIVESVGFRVTDIVGNSPHLSKTLEPGRAWLHHKFPKTPHTELDQMLGHILPGLCPGMLLTCERV